METAELLISILAGIVTICGTLAGAAYAIWRPVTAIRKDLAAFASRVLLLDEKIGESKKECGDLWEEVARQDQRTDEVVERVARVEVRVEALEGR